jgi:hypothetical protein
VNVARAPRLNSRVCTARDRLLATRSKTTHPSNVPTTDPVELKTEHERVVPLTVVATSAGAGFSGTARDKVALAAP